MVELGRELEGVEVLGVGRELECVEVLGVVPEQELGLEDVGVLRFVGLIPLDQNLRIALVFLQKILVGWALPVLIPELILEIRVLFLVSELPFSVELE